MYVRVRLWSMDERVSYPWRTTSLPSRDGRRKGSPYNQIQTAFPCPALRHCSRPGGR